MSAFGLLPPLAFAAPGFLWLLVALPVLWLILRLLPPAPIVRHFPGVALLLGLEDRESASARTPPWLLFLRIALVALAILGFAGPILDPDHRPAGTGPLLILADAGWADAGDWPDLRSRLLAEAEAAARAGRPLAFVALSDPAPPTEVVFGPAAAVLQRIEALEPRPWAADPARLQAAAAALPEGAFETVWQADGLDHPGRRTLLAALAAHGALRVVLAPSVPPVLSGPVLSADGIDVAILRAAASPPSSAPLDLVVMGADPNGVERVVARQAVAAGGGAGPVQPVSIPLPAEQRNRVSRIEIAGHPGAGSVVLAGDALRQRKVGLVDMTPPREGLSLLSPAHYLREALAGRADLVEAPLADVLQAAPQVIILTDSGRLPPGQEADLVRWVAAGGLLVRFAGPRLAASVAPDSALPDPLLPVRLRPGDRALGGSMSWESPRMLAPFAAGSPFAGLEVPPEVTVNAQVLAEPGPDLAAHTIAALADGTPLVTEERLEAGRIVLFHVTADASWSSLPISGLFVQMLGRLAVLSLPAAPGGDELKGAEWLPEAVLDGWGQLQQRSDLAAVPGERLAAGPPAPDMPPGIYRTGERRHSLNLFLPGARPPEAMDWPAGTSIERVGGRPERPLKGVLLALAMGLLALEGVAALWASGRVRPGARGPRGRMAGMALAAGLATLLALGPPQHARAQGADAGDADAKVVAAAGGMVLAHVLTGDADLDRLAEDGLRGLSRALTERTAVEPGAPIGVDPERDDLSVYTLLYWPVAADRPPPSAEAYRKLNDFLRTGGLILFDTRDGDGALAPGQGPEAEALRVLAAPLNIPPLAPLPPDHVLTRAFYLLDDFPGRYVGAPVWVEAPPPESEQAEGMPFRNLNDGVTPVVIGGNDWAAAWAIDEAGRALYPVGRGVAGERQREMALRFGINLVMHVLTGNYKSDQVHVPALLERLGQ